MFEGMFHGVPGTFACTEEAECRAENDADGGLAKLMGAWTFTPKVQEMGDDAYMVAGVVPDTDYLDFGYWIVTTQGEDGPGYTVGTYANGAEVYGSTDDCRRHGEVRRSGGRRLHDEDVRREYR